MDKKIMMIVAAVVVIIVIAAAAVIVLNKHDDKKEPADISAENGVDLDNATVNAAIENAKGSNLVITLTGTVTEASCSMNGSAMKSINDAGKTVTIKADGYKVAISAEEAKAIAAVNGKVTLKSNVTTTSSDITKVIGDKYTEARAMASFTVYDEKGNVVATTGSVSFTIPYKLDTKEKETAARAVQWDSTLKSTAATYADGNATITSTAGKNVYLAFMSSEDSAYYPVTYTTLISGNAVEQTLTHKPYSVVTLWDSSTELAILFGLKDSITFAYASADYTCLNKDLQETYNSLNTKKTYDSGITASLEEIRAADPDLILGWASSFVEGSWGIGVPATWNDRGTAVMVCNRPSGSLDDYYTIINNMGLACNMKDNADKIVNAFKDSTASFAKKLADAGITEKKNAIILELGYGDSGNDAYVYGASFLTGDLITKAGGYNLYQGGMDKKTVEEILNICVPDGEVVCDTVILFTQNNDAQATIDNFKNNAAFATLSAGVEGVYSFSFAQLYMGGVMEQDILDLIFDCMYPDL